MQIRVVVVVVVEEEEEEEEEEEDEKELYLRKSTGCRSGWRREIESKRDGWLYPILGIVPLPTTEVKAGLNPQMRPSSTLIHEPLNAALFDSHPRAS